MRIMIYFYYGPDEYSLGEAVQRLLRAAVPAETADLNITRMAADEVTLDGLRFACESLPFLADRRAVVVDHVFARLAARRQRERPDPPDAGRDSRLGGRRDGAQKGSGNNRQDRKERSAEREPALASEIARYLPNVPANALLVFVEGDAPPKSGTLAKALEQARVKQQYFPVLAGSALARWIKERTKEAGGALTDSAAQMLATYIGGDLRLLANEIKKLTTYAGPGRTVDVPEVQLLVSQTGEANVFHFVDAIGLRDPKRALVTLHTLLEHGERPERILGMVARQVRLLLQAKDLIQRGEPPAAVGQALGLPPFPLRKISEQVRLFPLTRLERMHRHVLETDVHIKTGQQEASLALEMLVAELASEAPVGSGS